LQNLPGFGVQLFGGRGFGFSRFMTGNPGIVFGDLPGGEPVFRLKALNELGGHVGSIGERQGKCALDHVVNSCHAFKATGYRHFTSRDFRRLF